MRGGDHTIAIRMRGQARARQVAAVLCLLVALVGPWSARGAGAASTAPAVVQVIGPGGSEQPLAALISGARLRVLVEAFALNDAAIVAALQAAQRRGVDVRVMLDPRGLQSAATLAALHAAAIRTRAPNPAYAVTHLDMVVVDAGATAILTTALTTDQLGAVGRGYMVIDRDPIDVLQAASIFYDDWLRRPVTGFGHHLLLLPDDASSIAGLISQAGSRLEVYSSALSDSGILAALGSARARRVVVRVLTPRRGDSATLLRVTPRAELRFLNDGAGTMLVVDRHTVLLGSMDLTSSTLTSSRELGVLLDGQALAKAVDATFFAQFARGVMPAPLPVRPVVKRGHTITKGSLRVSADLSPLVRVGGTGIIVVSTAAGARVAISITYPTGSVPGAGTAGKSGYADRQGRFVYRWIAAGRLKPGQAQVRILVQGAGTSAIYAASFAVAR